MDESDFQSTCRLCAAKAEDESVPFNREIRIELDEESGQFDSLEASLLVTYCLDINIDNDPDGLSTEVCCECIDKLKFMYSFKKFCRINHDYFMSQVSPIKRELQSPTTENLLTDLEVHTGTVGSSDDHGEVEPNKIALNIKKETADEEDFLIEVKREDASPNKNVFCMFQEQFDTSIEESLEKSRITNRTRMRQKLELLVVSRAKAPESARERRGRTRQQKSQIDLHRYIQRAKNRIATQKRRAEIRLKDPEAHQQQLMKERTAKQNRRNQMKLEDPEGFELLKEREAASTRKSRQRLRTEQPEKYELLLVKERTAKRESRRRRIHSDETEN